MLREVLFRLWGDLEEKKSVFLKTQNDKALKATGNSTESDTRADKPKALSAKPGDDLPPDSDDESTPKGTTARTASKLMLKDRDPNIGSERNTLDQGRTEPDLSAAISSLPITNKGFTCCIQQYGIRVPEKSYSKADAREGLRWKRVFGLFGTQIT